MKEQAVRQVVMSRSAIESHAINYAAATGVLSLIISLFIFHSQSVSLFGRLSIGLVASILGSVAAIVIFFIVNYRQNNDSRKRPSVYLRLRTLFTTAALAFVHAAVSFLLFASVFFLIQDGFKNLRLDSLTASAIVAVSVAVSSYVIYLASISTTTVRVSTLLALFLVSGSLTSMVTAEDPQWWERHFSALGAGSSLSSVAFNLTLIIAGIVIVSLADYIASDFERLKSNGTRHIKVKANAIRAILAVIGIFLACVGIFAYDTYPLVHNSTAGGMVIAFIALILALPYFVPSFSRSFFVLSYGLMLGLVFCYWLFDGIGYLNLTAFELIAAGIVFGWLVVFVRQIAADLTDSEYTQTTLSAPISTKLK